MTFIATPTPASASGEVRALYQRQQDKYGYVPNYARAFSPRPELMPLWAELLAGIKHAMDLKQFELATLAAALALRNSACSLAHGKALLRFFSSAELAAILSGNQPDPLSPAEQALMAFAGKVAADATAITRADVDTLRANGFTELDIFNITAAAAARAFFAKLLDGLGVLPDAVFTKLDESLKASLTVGRPIDTRRPEQLA
jgi:uncharacterized peroxidase-related enzyme